MSYSESASKQRIRVAIGWTSGGMFWESLESYLQTVPDIAVQSLAATQPLEGALGESCPHVLLLERRTLEGEPDYRRFFDLCPNLAIIALDSTGVESSVRLRDLGRHLLVKLICDFGLSSGAAGSAALPQVRHLKGADVERLTQDLPRRNALSILRYASTREHLEDVRLWLNLCLHQRLLREAETSGAVSTPQWAMSAERARELLGDAYASADERTLTEARRQLEEKMSEMEAASRFAGESPKLVRLIDTFNLGEAERQVLSFAFAPELDGSYARVFGFLNDDLTRRRPTASLLAQFVSGDLRIAWDVRQLLVGDGALAASRLVVVDPSDPSPQSEAGLMVAPDVVAYLLAEAAHSPAYGPHLALFEAAESIEPSHDPVTVKLIDKLAVWREESGSASRPPIIQLIGGHTTLDWFKRAVASIGTALVIFDVRVVREQGIENVLDSALGAARVARMHQAVLLVTGFENLVASERERLERVLIGRLRPHLPWLAMHGDASSLLVTHDAVWQVERVPPSFAARAALWQERVGSAGLDLSESDARTLAATVRFDESDIDTALRLCDDEPSPVKAIQAAARRIARTRVPSAARRLEAIFDWDDIVLPQLVVTQLRQIPTHVRQAGIVFEDWDYRSRLPYGQGVAALFSGRSGTGKTMAAQIIARELEVELFQVDLAKTVSKYIGETEKNLDQIFDAAERASAVLLFDEADALFGKRTEVKDAHDRYANVEVAFLLQRMESYGGLAILTTNLRQNIDDAFLRRLRFVIDFPAPDALHRQAIWQRVFPESAPLGEDVDVTFLARRLKLTGGHIQQIAAHAAFSAAAEGGPITMEHIVQATRDQLAKLGMLSAERSLTEYLPAAMASEQP